MHFRRAMATLALLCCLAGANGSVGADGYEHFAGIANSSYRLHQERVTWDTASAICRLEGGHLAVIDSADEASVVGLMFGRVAPFDPPQVWGYDLLHVGLNDKLTEGVWMTVLGVPISSLGYNVWRKGEPNNFHRKEDCGAISRLGEYSDLSCNAVNSLSPFVCEKVYEGYAKRKEGAPNAGEYAGGASLEAESMTANSVVEF